MSYILEALRRSQAERERGHVPGLHAQPVAADPGDNIRRTAPAGYALWLASGAAVVALLALLLWWTRLAPVVMVAPAPTPAPVQVPAPAPAPVPAVTPPAVAAQQAAAVPSPSPAATSRSDLPIVVSAPPAVAPMAQTAAPATTTVLPPPAVAAASASPRGTRPLALSDLAPDQRRELPPLVLGGSVWSDNAASRFVIFNGQIVHEGQPAAPGVVVERIGPKGAQLRWRGLLLEVPL